MKRCLGCGSVFAGADWGCPACHATPATIDGFVAFAPWLSDGSQGFAPESHDLLDGLQDASFWFRGRNRLIADLVRRFAPNARDVLEVGCGTGYVLAALRQALPYARLSGSEVDVHALALAKRRMQDSVDLFQMDGRAIPFREEFDLVCAFDVLEHIPEDEAVLADIHQALRPGGVALLAVPQHPFLWSWCDEYAKHQRRYRRRELADKCRRAGLCVTYQTSFMSLLLPVMAASRWSNRIRGNRKPSAELEMPAWIDRMFEKVLEGERIAIATGLRFPAGGSRFVVAQRPSARAADAGVTSPGRHKPAAGDA